MRAGDELHGAVFNRDHRYVIPIFQRPPVRKTMHPMTNRIRREAEIRMEVMGWPTKDPGRSTAMSSTERCDRDDV